MATNRPTTRRRSVRNFDEDDAPVFKKARTEKSDVNGAGAGKRTNGAAKGKAKVAYDEDDDGFQFTRRTSKRTTAAKNAPETIPEEPADRLPSRSRAVPPPAQPLETSKHPLSAATRRKRTSLAPPEPDQPSEPQKRRRSARLSGDKEQIENAQPASQPAPKRTKKSAPAEKRKQVTPAPEAEAGSVALVGVQTPKNELHVAKKRDPGATKIMLPFADTPVITRNKEMRKGSKDGHRRSSTGLRGRRASSLIDSGLSNALPHSEVETHEFYKYIEQSLPEPRRMKLLLTWCGSRALPEKPSGDVKDVNAIMAARAIQQELIDDFASKNELSDWFSREDTAPAAVAKKPNPVNVKNLAKLEELEQEVKRLEEEKAAWEALASSSKLMPPPPPPILSTPSGASLSDIDISLLDPSQAAILSALQSHSNSQPPPPSDASTSQPQPSPASSTSAFTYTTPAALQSHLRSLSLQLEPNIDLFADGIHKIEQYRNTAERVADRVLGMAAQRLEERDKDGREKAGTSGIGTGDLLRGLGSVLNE